MLSLNWSSFALGRAKKQRMRKKSVSVSFLPLITARFLLVQTLCSSDCVHLAGLSLVVGLVLYISNINDEMLNRTKSNEAYFSYNYGWSFAFAAISFLLTEVTPARSLVFSFPPTHGLHTWDFSSSRSKFTLAPNPNQTEYKADVLCVSHSCMMSSILFKGDVQTADSVVWFPHPGKLPPSTIKCHFGER